MEEVVEGQVLIDNFNTPYEDEDGLWSVSSCGIARCVVYLSLHYTEWSTNLGVTPGALGRERVQALKPAMLKS